MMNRVKVFADDSVEAMAKITRELGGDARIYSTRQVNGGIEIIAGPPDDEDEADAERPQRFNRPNMRQLLLARRIHAWKAHGWIARAWNLPQVMIRVSSRWKNLLLKSNPCWVQI